jgi:hypothetical protein
MKKIVVLICILFALRAAGQNWSYTTNLVTRPDNLAVAPWTPTGVTVTYGITDPLGGSTATKWTASATNPFDLQVFGPIRGSQYVLSIAAKADSGGARWLYLSISDESANAFGAYFDLTNGVTGSSSAVGSNTLQSKTITSLGGGWYQCTIIGTVVTTATASTPAYIDMRPTNADATCCTATTGMAIDFWHPQLNKGGTLQTYNSSVTNSKFLWFSFNGEYITPPSGAANPGEQFRMATSNDGITWVGNDGYWTDHGQVNAPQALLYQGNWFFHVAQANSENLTSCTWYVGSGNPTTGAVTTIATISWSSAVVGCASVFVGEWFVDDSGVAHLFIPVSNSGLTNFLIYETHPTNAALTSWSNPVNVSLGAAVNYYDPKVFEIGSTFYMWLSDNATSTYYPVVATASTLLGPYTIILSGNWAGWGGNLEGPTLYHTNHASTWTIALETIHNQTTPSHEQFYATCNTLAFDACTWSGKTQMTEDLLYRHGNIVRNPLSPAGIVGQ